MQTNISCVSRSFLNKRFSQWLQFPCSNWQCFFKCSSSWDPSHLQPVFKFGQENWGVVVEFLFSECFSSPVLMSSSLGVGLIIIIIVVLQIKIAQIRWLTPGVGVGGIHPSSMDMACIPSIFIKTFKFFFGESGLMSAFTKIFFGKLRMIEIGPRGRWKGASIFQASHPSKKVCTQKLTITGKRRRFVKSFTKKIQKVLMKIEEMADVFLNSANFAPHAFLTLAPPSGYTLNLKALIKN